ncbi:MAG: glycosyltransferase family 2 protein [Dehalococcoidia bacterium]|nr:glycosyltransferase family 2 protein [Dehalococcoidia bacterium]
MQYIVHQGMTHHGATFWVGANAVLRKRAIDQLVEEDVENGFPVRRYIKDRTVIEDTESSIDLRALGWRLYNYPERLSYSATPPDFGSLVIQRQRWANGGLVILPKLLRLLFRRNYLHGGFGSEAVIDTRERLMNHLESAEESLGEESRVRVYTVGLEGLPESSYIGLSGLLRHRLGHR